MSIKYHLSTTDVMVDDHGYEVQVVHGARFFRLTHKEALELAGALNEAVARETRRVLERPPARKPRRKLKATLT